MRHTWDTERVRNAAVAGICWLLLMKIYLCSSGCGGTVYDRARHTLTGIELVQQGATRALDAYDQEQHERIVADANRRCTAGDQIDRECLKREGGLLLERYRGKYQRARQVIGALHQGLSVAAAGVSAAEVARSDRSVLPVLKELSPALCALLGAFKDLGIGGETLKSIIALLEGGRACQR